MHSVGSSSTKKIYSFASGKKQHNSGQGCKVTHGDRILREKVGRDWCELAFVDFPKLVAEREQKHAHAQCHFDTSVSPRSKGGGGAMRDTNEQEPH